MARWTRLAKSMSRDTRATNEKLCELWKVTPGKCLSLYNGEELLDSWIFF